MVGGATAAHVQNTRDDDDDDAKSPDHASHDHAMLAGRLQTVQSANGAPSVETFRQARHKEKGLIAFLLYMLFVAVFYLMLIEQKDNELIFEAQDIMRESITGLEWSHGVGYKTNTSNYLAGAKFAGGGRRHGDVPPAPRVTRALQWLHATENSRTPRKLYPPPAGIFKTGS